jgi:undecaprenol kinase
MKAFLASVRFALNGIKIAWSGKNFRIQVVIALLIAVAGATFGISATEWLVILIFISLVLGLEVLNSAIEHIVNFVSPEFHPLAGRIKDLAAGAVLVVAGLSAVAGIIIFLPYLLKLNF